MLTVVLAACGLGAEGRSASDALALALLERDPERVSARVRDADRWRGRDPGLDRMLGDALANVLMRPDEGLDLLRANPAPDDPGWRAALLGATIRSGRMDALDAVLAEQGLEPMAPGLPARLQATARARLDPRFDPGAFLEAAAGCALVDRQPARGKQALDLPAPRSLPAAARALGAAGTAMERPEVPGDPDPAAGRGDWACLTGRLVEGNALPDPLPPHGVVVAARLPDGDLWVWVRSREGEPRAFAASDADRATRWIAEAGP